MRFSSKSIVGAGIGVVLLVSLVGCGRSAPAADCGGLAASNAYVVPAHAGSREMLGYMTLDNPGSKAVVVNGVSSSQFDRVIFQDKSGVNPGDDQSPGAKALGSFKVPANGDYKFSPGKHEIALYSPTQPYRPGDQVELTLTCGRDDATLSVPAVVRAGEDAGVSLPPADADTERTEKALQKGDPDTGGVSTTDDSRTAH